MILTPNSFKRIIYIKDYNTNFNCVDVNGCFLTPYHLIYNEKKRKLILLKIMDQG